MRKLLTERHRRIYASLRFRCVSGSTIHATFLFDLFMKRVIGITERRSLPHSIFHQNLPYSFLNLLESEELDCAVSSTSKL